MSFSTFTLDELNQLVIAEGWKEEDVPAIFNRFLQLISEEDQIIFGNDHFWALVLDDAGNMTEEEETMQIGGDNEDGSGGLDESVGQDGSDRDLDRHLDISEPFWTYVKRWKSDGVSFLVRFQEMEDVEDVNQLLLALFERVSNFNFYSFVVILKYKIFFKTFDNLLF